MKKRIISLILVVIMSALALVGCAYNIMDDDLADFVSYDKDAFLAALQAIEITGEDFGDDVNARQGKVLDAIYSSLSTNATDTGRKTEGQLGEHDNFYFCYYVEFTKDGKTYKIPTYMETAKALSVQRGQHNYTGDLAKKIASLIADNDYDFDNENADFEPVTSGNAAAGQLAVISFKTEYKAAGESTTTKDAVTNAIVVLDAANPIHKALIDKGANNANNIGVALDAFDIVFDGTDDPALNIDGVDITEAGLAAWKENDTKTEAKKVLVTEAKINYVIKANEFASFELETTGTSNFTDEYGHDVKDVPNYSIKYHVYAVAYSKVNALTAENIINLLYGKNFTIDIATSMYIMGAGLNGKTEEEKNAAIDAIAIAGVEAHEGHDHSVFETLVEDIVTALNDVSTKKTARDTAKDNLDKATEVTDDLKTAYNNAETAYNESKKASDELVKKLLSVNGMGDILVKGYIDLKYYESQTAYNKAIKEAAAKAIYKLITEMVTVDLDKVPEKAVDEAYDMLINNYKYNFYNGKATGATTEDGKTMTNYTYYMTVLEDGSFDLYLRDQVAADSNIAKFFDGTIETVKQAKDALRAYAKSTVVPVIQYSFIAQELDLEYDNKEFRKYKKDKNNNYETQEYYYGESTIRNGLQFEKLMKYFLESEKITKPEDARYENYAYTKNVKVTVNHK